jgi:curved DNA-binding protein CbpA
VAGSDGLTHDRARVVLSVGRHATPDEIRRAYRRAARTHHPDAGGDADTFRDVVAAADLLLDRAAREPDVDASPSTGRRAYPSTADATSDPATDRVDTSLLDGAEAPGHHQRWSRAGVAAAVLGAFDTSGPDHIAGASRRPGSLLNRFAHHLSDDLLSRWEVTGARHRGVAGRDLEVVATFPPGARRRVDRSRLPSGWSTTRNPAGTVTSHVVRPASTPAETAVRVANVVDELCTAIGWPLPDWFRSG